MWCIAHAKKWIPGWAAGGRLPSNWLRWGPMALSVDARMLCKQLHFALVASLSLSTCFIHREAKVGLVWNISNA